MRARRLAAGIRIVSTVAAAALAVGWLLWPQPVLPDEKELPPGSPEIVFFTATSARIFKGQPVTLRWQTSNADNVVLGKADPRDPVAVVEPQRVAASGSTEVTPQETATYRLKASNDRGVSVLRQVTVEVLETPAILSFTATPSTIRQGEASILRWRVSNAEHIWISRDRLLATTVRVEEASGEMRVTPERDATYQLHIRGRGGEDVVRELTVQVMSVGDCTISGRIIRDKREYGTRVGLYSPDTGERLFSTPVDDAGRYRFSKVPAGRYRVIPTGRYPNSKLAMGPKPPRRDMACEPSRSHTVDFEIVSWEG